jgi:hypothetical protein
MFRVHCLLYNCSLKATELVHVGELAFEAFELNCNEIALNLNRFVNKGGKLGVWLRQYREPLRLFRNSFTNQGFFSLWI